MELIVRLIKLKINATVYLANTINLSASSINYIESILKRFMNISSTQVISLASK